MIYTVLHVNEIEIIASSGLDDLELLAESLSIAFPSLIFKLSAGSTSIDVNNYYTSFKHGIECLNV